MYLHEIQLFRNTIFIFHLEGKIIYFKFNTWAVHTYPKFTPGIIRHVQLDACTPSHTLLDSHSDIFIMLLTSWKVVCITYFSNIQTPEVAQSSNELELGEKYPFVGGRSGNSFRNTPRCCLNFSSESRMSVQSFGKIFQSFGPRTEKDLSKREVLCLLDGISGTIALIADLWLM